MNALIRVMATAAVLATACTPFATKMDSWVGIPIQRRLNFDEGRAQIQATGVPDTSGQVVYVERIEKKCHVYWDVDAAGVITGWRSEGSACKHYWQ